MKVCTVLILFGVFGGYMLLLPTAMKLGTVPAVGWVIVFLYLMSAWLFGGEPQVTTLRNEPYPKLNFKEYLDGTIAVNGGGGLAIRIFAYMVYPGVLFGAFLHNLDVRLSKPSSSGS